MYDKNQNLMILTFCLKCEVNTVQIFVKHLTSKLGHFICIIINVDNGSWSTPKYVTVNSKKKYLNY